VPVLRILSRDAAAYRRLIEDALLPDLSITDDDASCDVVFGEPSLIAPHVAAMPRLRWIQSTWAGVEPLVAPGMRRDYTLTNARGVFGRQMVEYVFGYMLALERRLIEKYLTQRERQWDPRAPGSLEGKRVGLLGVGSIGADLARTAKHFGMHVRGYTRTSEDCPDVDEYAHGDSLIPFARDLDYLVLTLPSAPHTRRLVNAEVLAALPQRAVVINPGRGSTVDEEALIDALRSGRLAGAVLDVFDTEPLPPDHTFWTMDNVLITSHTAALSDPASIAGIFVENYRRYLSDEPLQYGVDFNAGY
jgi:phosphoglycerate dehydrogenase-like enzyme